MRFILRAIGLITVFTMGMAYGFYNSDKIKNYTIPLFYREVIESEENSTDSEETETE